MEIKNYEKATETLAETIYEAHCLMDNLRRTPFNKTDVEKRQNDVETLYALIKGIKKQTANVEDRLLDLEDYYIGQTVEN